MGTFGQWLVFLPSKWLVPLNCERHRALIVNAVGDAAIDFCDGTRTIAEIAAVLRAALNVPSDIDVEADVKRLIVALENAGIVKAS